MTTHLQLAMAMGADGIAEAAEWIEAAEEGSVDSATFSAFSGSNVGRWLDECYMGLE